MQEIRLLSIGALTFLFSTSFAQQPSREKVDSLLAVYPILKTEKQKLHGLINLSREFRIYGDRKTSIEYAHQAEGLALTTKDTAGLLDALLNKALSYRELKNYSESRSNTEKLLEWSRKLCDSIRISDAFDNFGHIYAETGEPANALINHFTALRIREQFDEYGAGNSCDNIGHLYATQSRHQDALKYFMKSQEFFKKRGDLSRETLSTANVGAQLYLQGNYPASLLAYFYALEKYHILKNDSGEAWMYRSIGKVLADSNNPQKALQYFKRSLTIEEKLDNKNQISELYQLLAKVLIQTDDTEKATIYLSRAFQISESVDDWEGLVNTYYIMSEVNMRSGNLEKALYDSELALNLALKNNLMSAASNLNTQIAEIYLDFNQPRDARNRLLKAIDINRNLQTGKNLHWEYRLLAEAEEKLGNFKDAFAYLDQATVLNNKLDVQQAAQLALQYETDKKENALRREQSEKDHIIRRELIKNAKERNQALVALGITFLFSAAIVFIFYYRRKKIEAEHQNTILEQGKIEALREAELFKSKYFANVSHEFRTVMTLLKGHIDQLHREETEKRLSSDSLQKMYQNSDRLLELVNQILDYSKVDQREYILVYEDAVLLKKLENYVFSYESYAARKNIAFSVHITDRARTALYQQLKNFSPEAVQIIISNLLSNAIKFTPEYGEVKVTIDFSDNQLMVSVSDSGTGIPEKEIPNIFRRFYQAPTAQHDEYKGSGIGLSLVKELTALHQGEVWVENNADKGCTFTMRIQVNPAEQMVENPEPEIPDQDKPIVLIVENQKELRTFIKESLASEYNCLEASNGSEGIDLAIKYLPDVVISDILMPIKDGYELSTTLKNHVATSHIPIILISGTTADEVRIKGIESGADAFLSKPFAIAELQLRIRNVLSLLENIRNRSKTEKTANSSTRGLSKRDSDLLEKLKNAIHENIANTRFSVEDLAGVAFLSQSQLTRKLKAIAGQTPSELIRNFRIDHACELLKEGHSISETAWQVGFEDAQYFSKVFKKHLGIIPSDYWKQEIS